ncbi:MAG: hypothetical protein JJU29_02920 [Verrucomicrobia bacterium]|nr:hypothetical protein [Verrucomicrobiota bacterium]MCH8511125.1 hypothetical protein [Kiritimatiellia bacterium]
MFFRVIIRKIGYGEFAHIIAENFMQLLADTHVHVYPDHDPAVLLTGTVKRLRHAANSPAAACAVFLTEGRDFNWFAALRDGSHGLPEAFKVSPCDEEEAVRISWGSEEIHVFAGRQIVAAERVEILALTMASVPNDGLRAADVVADVDGRGAIPVLAWAPGKWMFSRAKVVEGLLGTARECLHIGDSALRCRGWPEPKAMGASAYPVLAGSDPLPVPGEEKWAGAYGIRMELNFDREAPVASVRKALKDPQCQLSRIGRRNSAAEMGKRMFAHRQQKREASK